MCPGSGPGDGEKWVWDGMGLPALEVKGVVVHRGGKEVTTGHNYFPSPRLASDLIPSETPNLPAPSLLHSVSWGSGDFESKQPHSVPSLEVPEDLKCAICYLQSLHSTSSHTAAAVNFNRWCLPPPPPPLRGPPSPPSLAADNLSFPQKRKAEWLEIPAPIPVKPWPRQCSRAVR